MPHQTNSEEFGDTGQDHPDKEPVQKYDRIYGSYTGQKPAVSPTKSNDQIAPPFKLGE